MRPQSFPWIDRNLAARRLADILVRMETGVSRWLFVVLNGELVGQGQVDVSAELYATVGLALRKPARGHGIGLKLMRLLEEEARKLKRYRLELTVWSANIAAVELYRKLGYKEIGRRSDWHRARDGEGYSDLIHMAKLLPEAASGKTRGRKSRKEKELGSARH
jgi:ribosomal protein S18 acetylase RimI-like enzyme